MDEIIGIILSFIGVVLTSVIIPYIKEKTTAEQKKRIKLLVKGAVAAAEQIVQGRKRGKERFEYVAAYLKKHCVKLSDEELKAMVESEVYILNNIYSER